MSLIVTMAHARTVPYFHVRRGLCVPKMRIWCARQGIDFRAFVRDGIPAETLLATGDGIAEAVVKWAHECEGVPYGRE